MNPSENLRDATWDYLGEREALFAPAATKSSDAIRRRVEEAPDLRAPYSRDSDRILHSRAYARYIDKTQVFSLLENDHITHRVLHVQLVSKIARTVGRSLRLNEDLIEAIALGHDIGHIPFGHFGESCLDTICRREGIGRFRHNIQGVRFLDEIEDLNLTLQVLDGILCHDGESRATRLVPLPIDGDDPFLQFENKINAVLGDHPAIPATPEGCVVRFSDTIAYIARDLRDAAEVGLIDGFSDLPEEIRDELGDTERDIINTLTIDLMETSRTGEECLIGFSDDIGSALNGLKTFNYRHIYEHEMTRGQDAIILKMFQTVYDALKEDLEEDRAGSRIFTDYLDTPWLSEYYKNEISSAGAVRDFIAGMTDRYFERVYTELVLPRKFESYRLFR
ncbi:dGTPase [Methanocalculus alkaliphilus]|uniref:deoxyguanosinetriphosphate triphosphohydrolase family protein n=1 Tax=Methanocalculus alkaliphilus TaxID=768730 RepID=UPI00209E316C|nr:HD domain-containing protein [Methanocalculus alkaliphilus]MCP1716249.1 dGTPase [Methanocalculus alkaliphilus]